MSKGLLTIRDLKNAFSKYQVNISDSWIRRQEEKGNLFLPRSTTNFKRAQGFRKAGAVRQFTKEQLREILIAFLPKGTVIDEDTLAKGTGYFNYLKK